MSTALTSYDPDELKNSLIEFMSSKPEFADFNYEGSAINTIIDLLVRNSHYIAYMANMVSTESFLDSAQLRANVVSHAQKLSMVPKSRTATTVVCDLTVTPSAPTSDFSIVADKGSVFITTVANVTYSFTLADDVTLLKGSNGTFTARDVILKQGQLLRQRFTYSDLGQTIEIPNTNIDTSTLRVFVRGSITDTATTEFMKVEEITEASSDSSVFFLAEGHTGLYTIEFGKGILGKEPEAGAVVEVEYVNVESEHANGVKSLLAASPIGRYSNIRVDVVVEGYGGSERDTIENMRFLAPKLREAQNRAVRESDYIAIMRREFPFIKSAIAWGGEKNNPPYYGRVFMCAIPNEGFVIADSVKDIIKTTLSRYSVGSITPEVVDPEHIGLDLNVGILFDGRKTTRTFTQTVTEVRSVIDRYNDSDLRTFDFWYNNSLLLEKIGKVSGVFSVEVTKRAFAEREGTVGKARYDVDFLNPIQPGSITTSGVLIDSAATSQSIYDNGLGSIVQTVIKSGRETSTVIGSVDYVTGRLNFGVQLLAPTNLRVFAVPKSENFYTERNFVTYINGVDVYQITTKREAYA